MPDNMPMRYKQTIEDIQFNNDLTRDLNGAIISSLNGGVRDTAGALASIGLYSGLFLQVMLSEANADVPPQYRGPPKDPMANEIILSEIPKHPEPNFMPLAYSGEGDGSDGDPDNVKFTQSTDPTYSKEIDIPAIRDMVDRSQDKFSSQLERTIRAASDGSSTGLYNFFNLHLGVGSDENTDQKGYYITIPGVQWAERLAPSIPDAYMNMFNTYEDIASDLFTLAYFNQLFESDGKEAMNETERSHKIQEIEVALQELNSTKDAYNLQKGDKIFFGLFDSDDYEGVSYESQQVLENLKERLDISVGLLTTGGKVLDPTGEYRQSIIETQIDLMRATTDLLGYADSLAKENTGLESQRSTLEQKLTEFEGMSDAEKAKHAEALNKLALDYETKLKGMDDIHSSLQSKLADYSCNINAYESAKADLTSRVETLTLALEDMAGRNETLSALVGNHGTTIRLLEDEIEVYKATQETIEGTLAQLREDYENLQEDYELLEGKLDAANKEIAWYKGTEVPRIEGERNKAIGERDGVKSGFDAYRKEQAKKLGFTILAGSQSFIGNGDYGDDALRIGGNLGFRFGLPGNKNFVGFKGFYIPGYGLSEIIEPFETNTDELIFGDKKAQVISETGLRRVLDKTVYGGTIDFTRYFGEQAVSQLYIS